MGLSDESSSDDGLDLSEHVAPTEDEQRDMLQRVEAHRAAEGRGALHDARQAARREGRPEEWWVARPPTQARCGLANSGATCYLNSLLQALYALEEVRREVYTVDEPATGSDRCVPWQLARLFARMQLSRAPALSTRALTGAFGWGAAEASRQHDVQELARVLLDALGRAGLPVEARLFGGTLRSTLRCLACGHEKARDEAFADVQLDIGDAATVDDALRAFTRWERLDGENAWHCAACAARVPALKGVSFAALPPLLFLHLKRFTYDLHTGRRRKLTHRVAFPPPRSTWAPTAAPAATTTTPPTRPTPTRPPSRRSTTALECCCTLGVPTAATTRRSAPPPTGRTGGCA